MSSLGKLVFYNAIACPYAQRAAIALKEAGADYEQVIIDLENKPEWYKNVNPELKVPALEAEGTHIAESLVIIEYINDRFPEKKLLPDNALQRAQIRFAIEFFNSKITSEWHKLFQTFKSVEAQEAYHTNINAALVRFDEILHQQAASGPYFLGEQYSLADVAITPFYARIHAFNKLAFDGRIFDAIKNSSRLTEFFNGITSRHSFQETYVGDEKFISLLKKRFEL